MDQLGEMHREIPGISQLARPRRGGGIRQDHYDQPSREEEATYGAMNFCFTHVSGLGLVEQAGGLVHSDPPQREVKLVGQLEIRRDKSGECVLMETSSNWPRPTRLPLLGCC